jgi:energy-coupling factor transporter ATP-binding protein EcfA2
MFSPVNEALVRLKKRAETGRSDPAFVRETFVDVTNSMMILQNENPQLVLGRRGSGKTHTLLALAGRVRAEGNIPVYVDLREIGSNGSIYEDPALPLEQRGTRLFLDLAAAIHEELRQAIYEPGGQLDLLRDPGMPHALDSFATMATKVKLAGPTEIVERTVDSAGGNVSAGVDLGTGGLTGRVGLSRETVKSGSTFTSVPFVKR